MLRQKTAETRRTQRTQGFSLESLCPLCVFCSKVFCETVTAWRAWGLSVALLALLLLAGCSPQVQPLVFGEPVWQDGETSAYRVTNVEGRVVGEATVSLHAGGEHAGGDAWTLRRAVQDVAVYEEVVVEFRSQGYTPVYTDLVRRDGAGSQRVEATIDRAQVNIALTNRLGNTVYERVSAPSDIRDERTLLTLVRTLPLAPGYAVRLNSFLPVVGQTERVTVVVDKAETITVPAGTFAAWKVELRTPDRTTTAWIAQDPPHPVVKFIDGRSKATFDLVAFR